VGVTRETSVTHGATGTARARELATERIDMFTGRYGRYAARVEMLAMAER